MADATQGTDDAPAPRPVVGTGAGRSRRTRRLPRTGLPAWELALLAGIVQSPSRYDPINDEAEATKRRNIVLQRMADVGDVPQEEADKAKEAPLGLKVSKPNNGCITAVKGASFFCKYVEKVFLSDPVFGKNRVRLVRIGEPPSNESERRRVPEWVTQSRGE